METHELQTQQDRQRRNRLIVLGVLLTILLCVLFAPIRHLSGWWNADGSAEVTDTTTFDVADADGHHGADALSPFLTNVDRLFALDDVTDLAGLEGILIAGPTTPGATPELITLIASTEVGGALDDNALGNGALGAAEFGDGAFGGRATERAALPGGAFFGGGSAGFGGSGSSASAALSQSETRQSRSGHTLRTDSGDNGNGLGTLGSGSSDDGNASGSGDSGNPGGSGGGDGVVFVSDPGNQGPTDGGVNVSVYASGPDGGTILSDPSVDPLGGSGPGVSLSAVDPVPVPEPATLLLLGSGLVAAGYRLNRRRPS